MTLPVFTFLVRFSIQWRLKIACAPDTHFDHHTIEAGQLNEYLFRWAMVNPDKEIVRVNIKDIEPLQT